MAVLRGLVLYAGLLIGANAALADTAALEALREGSLKKLAFAAEPVPLPDTLFTAPDGSDVSIHDFQGRYLLVNFWATWCAPCRKEMPGLSALQTELGSDDFQVVTIATGRNPEAAVYRFLSEIGVDNLPVYRDPRQALARDLAILGLPVSILVDRDAKEIARLIGDAEWDSSAAKAIVSALVETR